MKRILATLLALTLLLASSAIAETSGTMFTGKLTNIKVFGVDMSDLEIVASAGAPAGSAVAQADVYSNGEALAGLAFEFVNGRALIALDGAENTYALDLRAQGVPAGFDQVLAALFSLLPQLSVMQPPAVQAVSLPMVSFCATLQDRLGDAAEADAQGKVNAVIPSDQVLGMLDQVMESVDQYASAFGMIGQLDQIRGLYAQLKSMGLGLELHLTAKDAGNESTLDVDFHPVNKGVVSGSAARLQVTSGENKIALTLDRNNSRIASIRFETEPGEPRATFRVTVPGQGSLQFNVFPSNGLQIIAATFEAGDAEANLTARYGQTGDGYYRAVEFRLPGEKLCYEISATTVIEESGNQKGVLQIYVQNSNGYGYINADLETIASDEVTLKACDAAGAVDLTAEGAMEQFQKEARDALKPLMEYIQNVSQAAA